MARSAYLLAVLVLALVASSPSVSQSTFAAPEKNPIEAPASILGVWGTPAQCEAHQAGKTDDMRLLPYEIGEQWLKHGFLYCWMGWRHHQQTERGTQTVVIARCGEDSIRFYRLIVKHNDDILTMRWSKDYDTPPLSRCE